MLTLPAAVGLRDAGAAANPRSIPGLMCLFDADAAPTYQDTARTAPGGDGAAVLAWDDAGPLARHATGGSPIALLPDPVLGVNCLAFEGAQLSGAADFFNAATAPLTASALTLVALVYCETYQNSTGPQLFEISSSASGTPLFHFYDPTALKCRARNDAGTIANTSTSTPDARGSWSLLEATWDGVTVRACCNGVSLGSFALAGPMTVNRLRVNGGSAGNTAHCKIAAAGAWGRCLNDGERLQARAWLQAKLTAAAAESLTPTAAAPTDLPGLDSWHDAKAATVLRNGGSAATATGNVTAWQPSSGSLTLSQPGGLDAPTMQQTGSTPFVRFQTTGTPSLGVNLGASRTLSALTIHIVYRLKTYAAKVTGVALGTDRASPQLQMLAGPTGSDLQHVCMAPITAGNGGSIGQNIVMDDHWHAASIVFSSRRARLFIEGVECVAGVNNTVPPSALQTDSGVSTLTQAGLWLGYQGAGLVGGYDVASVSVHLAEHTPAQHRQFLAWARSYYSELFANWATDPVAVFFGASNLLSGSGATDHMAARLCLAATAKYTRAYTLATGSLTSPPLRQRVERQLKYLFAGRSGKKVLCVYIGGNDYRQSFSVANIEQFKVWVTAAAIAAGADVVIEGTQLPGTGVSNTDRATVNTYLGTQVSSTYKLAALAAESHIGPDGADADTNLYSDGIHLTDTGQGYAATVWGTAIDAQMP